MTKPLKYAHCNNVLDPREAAHSILAVRRKGGVHMRKLGIVFGVLVACKTTARPGVGGTQYGGPPAQTSSGASDSGVPQTTGCSDGGAPRVVKVYVSGESIEERNHFVAAPFQCSGALVNRGVLNNDNDEYGWMVPLAQRVNLRDPTLALEFVGAGPWTDAESASYTGTYPSSTPGRTSALAGTDIETWVYTGIPDRGFGPRRDELLQKTHCYDIAFASRGGNDLNHDVSDIDYKQRLSELVRLLLDGSSCRTDPLVYVTAHLPDREDVSAQTQAFYQRTVDGVNAIRADATLAQSKRDLVRFIDVFGAFKANRATTSMPKPAWFNGSAFDLTTIGREGDAAHPRRLASIYAGEIVADALDLSELQARAK